jgi:hypothetical protein
MALQLAFHCSPTTSMTATLVSLAERGWGAPLEAADIRAVIARFPTCRLAAVQLTSSGSMTLLQAPASVGDIDLSRIVEPVEGRYFLTESLSLVRDLVRLFENPEPFRPTLDAIEASIASEVEGVARYGELLGLPLLVGFNHDFDYILFTAPLT